MNLVALAFVALFAVTDADQALLARGVAFLAPSSEWKKWALETYGGK